MSFGKLARGGKERREGGRKGGGEEGRKGEREEGKGEVQKP